MLEEACPTGIVPRSRECEHSSQDAFVMLSYVLVLHSNLHRRGHPGNRSERLLGMCRDQSSHDVNNWPSSFFVLSSKLHGRGHSGNRNEHLRGKSLQQTYSPPTTRILGAGGLKEQKRRPNAGRRQRFRSHAASHAGKVAPCFSCVRGAVDLGRAHDRRANGLVARKK